MKVVISLNSPRRDGWLRVFGSEPIEVVPALRSPLKYRIKLDALTMAQRTRLIVLVSERRKVPVDIAMEQIERRGVGILCEDVEVVNETETLWSAL